MTTEEYFNKLICYTCSFGEKVSVYSTKLGIGHWCEEDEQNLIILKSLIEIFENYDLRDLPNFTTDYNNITKDNLFGIMNLIEKLI